MEKDPTYEHWINCKWRPMAAWTYIGVTIFDFVISPIVFSWFQYSMDQPISQWNPLTLQGSGLFHIAFGAIVGINAYSRTIEKMNLNLGPKEEKKEYRRYGYPSRDYDDQPRYQHRYED